MNDQPKTECNLDLEKSYLKNEECEIWESLDNGTYIRYICLKHGRMRNCFGDKILLRDITPNEPKNLLDKSNYIKKSLIDYFTFRDDQIIYECDREKFEEWRMRSDDYHEYSYFDQYGSNQTNM